MFPFRSVSVPLDLQAGAKRLRDEALVCGLPLPATPSPTLRLRLFGGLPDSAMPGERPRCWGQAPVSTTDIERAEALMLAGRPGAPQELSLYRAFQRWRTANFYDQVCHGEVLAIFAGYLANTDLAASTCATYVRQAEGFCRREDQTRPPRWHLCDTALKGLDLLAAAAGASHAVDISEARAQAIIAMLRAEDVRFALWAMCMCGGRVADLLRLTPAQFRLLGNTKLVVHFMVTKSARTLTEQYSVELPMWLPFEPQWLKFWDGPTLFTADADRINKILHAAGYKETTYSFRRLFVHRIIDRFSEDGIIEWAKVIQLTGHQQEKSVRGHYQDHRRLTPVV